MAKTGAKHLGYPVEIGKRVKKSKKRGDKGRKPNRKLKRYNQRYIKI